MAEPIGQQTLEGFDSIYFQDKPWQGRVDDWLSSAATSMTTGRWRMGRPGRYGFADGNRQVVVQAIGDEEFGLRVLVNIGTHAFLQFLPDGRYLNLYEKPVIGGERKVPSPERTIVDNPGSGR